MGDPVLVPFDLEQVDPILLASARAMAYDVNSGLEWKSDNDTFFYWLANPLHKAYSRVRYGTYGSVGPGSEVVDIKYDKVRTDTENFHQLFRTNFLRFCESGPGPAVQYLQERIHWTQRSWFNMRERFAMAGKINDDVSGELNRSKALTRVFMVAGGVSATVLGTIVPVSWIVSSIGGVAYSFLCQLAKSAGDAASGDVVGFQQPVLRQALTNSTTMASVTNAVLSTGINYAQGNKEVFLNQAKAAGERLERKLAQYTAQSGSDLTGPQRKIVAELGRKAGGIGAQSNAAVAARQLRCIKGASIGVGLLFMVPDFIDLFHDLRDVARDVTK